MKSQQHSLVLEEDLKPYKNSTVNVNNTVVRFRDANREVGGQWKAQGERCHNCGALACGCSRDPISPRTKRQRMLTVETPYDRARKAKFFKAVEEAEERSRAEVIQLRSSQLKELRRYRRIEAAMIALAQEEAEDRLQLYSAVRSRYATITNRFNRSLAFIGFEASEHSHRQVVERREVNRLAYLWDLHAAELQLLLCVEREDCNRSHIENMESELYAKLCLGLVNGLRMLDDHRAARAAFVASSFDFFQRLVITEAQRREEILSALKVDEETIVQWTSERDAVLSEFLYGASAINNMQLDQRAVIRATFEREEERARRLTEKRAAERADALECVLAARRQLEAEELRQREDLLAHCDQHYCLTLQVTQTKLERRAHMFEAFMDGVAELSSAESEVRGALTAECSKQHEQRLQWIDLKMKARELLEEEMLIDLFALHREEDVSRAKLERRWCDEEVAVHARVAANAEERKQLLNTAYQGANEILAMAVQGFQALQSQMLAEEAVIREIAKQRRDALHHCVLTETQQRKSLIAQTAHTRQQLANDFAAGAQAIEQAFADFVHSIEVIENAAICALNDLALDEAEERDGFIDLWNTGVELALERQCLREQQLFFGYETRYRGKIGLAEIDATSTLLAMKHDDLEAARRRNAELFDLECDAVLHEYNVASDWLWSKYLEGVRMLDAEERIERSQARQREADRLQAEMLSRQAALSEDPRCYDEGELPLEEGRTSYVHFRRSVALLQAPQQSMDPATNFEVTELELAMLATELPAVDTEEMPPALVNLFASVVSYFAEIRMQLEKEETILAEQLRAASAHKENIVKEITFERTRRDRYLDKQETDAAEFEKKVHAEKVAQQKIMRQIKSEELRYKTARDALKKLQSGNDALRDSLHRKLGARR